MKNTINFIKYHTVEFSKFAGIISLFILFGAVAPFGAGVLTFEFLFPIVGMWVWPMSMLAMILVGYVVVVMIDARIRKNSVQE
jgi:hypothetical protein